MDITSNAFIMPNAESEICRLRVDDDKLSQMLSLGFTEREARLGLRSANGTIDRAVTQIMNKREEREKRKQKEKEEREKKQMGKKLGKTANGEWVNVDTYKMLLSMGFQKGSSREALRQANNNLSAAFEVLSTQPELLSLPDPFSDFDISQVTDDMLIQVTSMGFDIEVAREALRRFGGSEQQAIDELLKNGGILATSSSSESSSSSSSGAGTSSSSSPTKSPEEQQRGREAIETIVGDIPEDEEDYLDVSLEDEFSVLQKYKALLDSTGQ